MATAKKPAAKEEPEPEAQAPYTTGDVDPLPEQEIQVSLPITTNDVDAIPESEWASTVISEGA